MNNSSWKTTLCGLLALVGGALVQFFPEYAKLGGFLAFIGSGAGLLFARDNNVTSEQAGAKSSAVATTFKLGLIVALCGVAASASLTGCKTPYQAAGVVVVTADRAADGWADYVVWTKHHPPYDTNTLARQEMEVRGATLKYQSAMDAVYFARTAATTSGDTNAPPEAVLLASQRASASLVNLILSFLPVERAKTLNTAPQ